MPKTLIKLRLPSNKHRPKIKQNLILLSQIYRHIYNPLNRNYYQKMAF